MSSFINIILCIYKQHHEIFQGIEMFTPSTVELISTRVGIELDSSDLAKRGIFVKLFHGFGGWF